jgi:hypothetical protein
MTCAHTPDMAFLNNGFPPEVSDNWLPIGAAFVVPLICGIALEGTLHTRPGFFFFLGLFTGLGATIVAMVIAVLKARKK